MSRNLCTNCLRPDKSCICAFITAIDNDIHVVILQHPSEVSHAKNTITLLERSLTSCDIIVGENFLDNKQLLAVMEKYSSVLLYPSHNAQILTDTVVTQLRDTGGDNLTTSKPLCLILLDGTWKKAYKMFMLSSNLQQIPHVCLPESLASAGQYHIRKVAKKNALSSLEACSYALALLECQEANHSTLGKTITANNAGQYQPLLDQFQRFNQFQLSFRPKHNSDKDT